MPIQFQVERFLDIVSELPPLWYKHWRILGTEQDRVPLAPDFERYAAMDQAGILHIVTARIDGKLVGYFFNAIDARDLHYTGLKKALTDIYFLDPAIGSGLSLVTKYRAMVKVVRRELKALGVQKHMTAVKLHSDIGMMWDRLGYTPVERVYYDMLED